MDWTGAVANSEQQFVYISIASMADSGDSVLGRPMRCQSQIVQRCLQHPFMASWVGRTLFLDVPFRNVCRSTQLPLAIRAPKLLP